MRAGNNSQGILQGRDTSNKARDKGAHRVTHKLGGGIWVVNTTGSKLVMITSKTKRKKNEWKLSRTNKSNNSFNLEL